MRPSWVQHQIPSTHDASEGLEVFLNVAVHKPHPSLWRRAGRREAVRCRFFRIKQTRSRSKTLHLPERIICSWGNRKVAQAHRLRPSDGRLRFGLPSIDTASGICAVRLNARRRTDFIFASSRRSFKARIFLNCESSMENIALNDSGAI